jgi:hypothetical protein
MSTETRLVMTIAPSDALYAGARNGADQLVERIVAADILAHADHALAGMVEASRMNRAGFGAKFLVHRQRPDSLADIIAAESEFHRLAIRQGPERFLDGFNAAQAASDRSGHLAASGGKGRLQSLGKLHLDVKALIGLDDLQRHDMSRCRADDGFRQGKADAEIL